MHGLVIPISQFLKASFPIMVMPPGRYGYNWGRISIGRGDPVTRLCSPGPDVAKHTPAFFLFWHIRQPYERQMLMPNQYVSYFRVN